MTHWNNFRQKQERVLRRELDRYPFVDGDTVRNIHTKQCGTVRYIELLAYDNNLGRHIWYLEVTFGGYLKCYDRTTLFVKERRAQH